MSSLKGLIPRLRKYFGERRAAPRYATHLEQALAVHVYLADAKAVAGRVQETPRLIGYTRDVSETGLGLVVPAVRIAGRNLVSPERTLRVVVGLPHDEPVEMHVVGVRSIELEEGDPEGGYLVGVHIHGMAPEDRKRYLKYLRSFAVGEI